MYKFLALAALLAVASADPIALLTEAHPLSPNGRIVGGAPTTIQDVPYQVVIRVFGSAICGGSIISENWVVTAAHCNDYPTSWYTIRAGSTFSNSGGSIHSLAAIINHANYRSTSAGIPVNDIGLYRLATKLSFDSTRQAIPLFSSNEGASVGAMAVITGWGTLTQGGSTPTVLQTVSVPIVSKSSCSSAYSVWGGLPAGQICAAYPEGGKDACQGDSGGPLAINGRLAGIVSWGNGCARPGFPGAYTEVAAFRDWIATNSATPKSEDTSTQQNLKKPSLHIVGGHSTDIKNIPYQVQIQVRGLAVCGGSIISDKWVLSAAHCVFQPIKFYSIRVGTNFKNKGGTVHSVRSIVKHFNYQRNKINVPTNDICLFHLSRRIKMDSSRQPIRLFNYREQIAVGTQCLVSGWGAQKEGNIGVEVLRSVTVPIISKKECALALPETNKEVPPGQICAGYPEGGKDTCQGDSGGPLAIRGRLAGVVSWGIGCARPNKPGLYTEIAYYRQWIYYITATSEGRNTSIQKNFKKHGGYIVGGEPTNIKSVPYQVQVEAHGSLVCGGIIISDKWILGAAHCVSEPVNVYKIRVGTSFMSKGGTVHSVENIYKHFDYYKNHIQIAINDICLFLLSTRIKMDSSSQPIRLFNYREQIAAGTPGLVSGWGTKKEGGYPEEVLHSVTVPVISKSECALAFPEMNYKLPHGQICTGYPEGGRDSCNGDSGGPFVIKGRLAGIVSWSIGCARSDKPNAYTEVAYYRYWIYYITGI